MANPSATSVERVIAERPSAPKSAEVSAALNTLIRILKPLTSLRLTIACLLLAMVLVFVGTLAQKDLDAFYAQKRYFNSWFVFWSPAGKDWRVPVFPGGFLLGTVLLVNLIAAHVWRFTLSAKKLGIVLAHIGLILMLVGGLFTSLWSRDSRMVIPQGGTSNYAESFKDTELAVIDRSPADHDEVVSISAPMLAKEQTIQHPKLPFTIKTVQFFPNADVNKRAEESKPAAATQGFGTRLAVTPQPETTRPEQENLAAAVVELSAASGPLGRWLVCEQINRPQTVSFGGKNYDIQLRRTRYYKPYSIHLNKLTHEEYAGTNIPKNFASDIRLVDPERHEDRDTLIYMNHPLRYHGETFYQFQTLQNDKFTVFEVVRNPSWMLPYLSCLIVAFGLIYQFGFHLTKFFEKRFA
jgi:ResB-like family protein